MPTSKGTRRNDNGDKYDRAPLPSSKARTRNYSIAIFLLTAAASFLLLTARTFRAVGNMEHTIRTNTEQIASNTQSINAVGTFVVPRIELEARLTSMCESITETKSMVSEIRNYILSKQ